LANQKGNPDYHHDYPYFKLEFATALNVRTQEKIRETLARQKVKVKR
jgi:hypothetical protein